MVDMYFRIRLEEICTYRDISPDNREKALQKLQELRHDYLSVVRGQKIMSSMMHEGELDADL